MKTRFCFGKFITSTFLWLLTFSPASASYHFWGINEIYSSADGSVQFVEFFTSSTGQQFLGGQSVTCSGPLGTSTFNFPSNLLAGTANKTFIIGTSNLTSIPGGLNPDYVFTNAKPFLFLNAGATNTVTLVGAATSAAVYTNLPADGFRSLIRTGSGSSFASVVTNSPKNYNNQSNKLVPLRFSSAAMSGADFVLSFATATGPNGTTGSNYAVEAKSVVESSNWAGVTNVTGDGTAKTVAIPFSPLSNKFFRLRVP